MEVLNLIKEQLKELKIKSPPHWDRRYLRNVNNLSKPIHKVKEERNVYMSVRDGTKLCLDIFRPDEEGKFPALVAWGGYGKELQSIDIPPQPWESYIFNHNAEVPDIKFFVERGYSVIVPDPRGIGRSEGEWMMPFTKQEVQDCYDVIEWVATQQWCDGNIGMIGLSWFGTIQLLVAALQPPHLKAIFPLEVHYNFYDRNYPGGVLTTFLWFWEDEVPFHTARPHSLILYTKDEVKKKIQALLEDPDIRSNPYLYSMLKPWENGRFPQAHPCFFDVLLNNTDNIFWQERSVGPVLDKVEIPVYFGSPWYLTAYTVGIIKCFIECKSKIKKLMFFQPDFKLPKLPELKEEILRWYDHWLKGIDTGITEEPPIKIFVRGIDKWRYEYEWPISRTRWTKLYLNTFNRLERYPEEEESLPPDVFIHKPPIVSTEIPSVAYSTRPLAQALEITGQIVTYLYAEIDQTDATFHVTLYDVTPSGERKSVSKGYLKASHRVICTEKSMPWQPHYLHSKPQPVKPGEIHEYPIEMEATSYTFFPEHRIQLEITSWRPLPQIHHHKLLMMTTLPSSRLTHYRIYRDAKYQSHVLLPIIHDTPKELWIEE